MDAMDEEAVRRLNAVQLEDLGTARREYISTVDTNKKFRNVTIEAIEAAREANKKGSAVHRLAEKNKDSLNAWNTAWQTMCEEVDLEDLDPLMGGQTHRAHLSALVKENGGQNYGKNPVPTKPAAKGHKPVGVSGRGALAPTRGRGGSHARPALDSAHGRPLDPARDCNNKNSPPRGISKKRGDMLGGMRRPPKPPTLRTRRAVGPSVVVTYNNLLADSSEFMSAISNLIPPKPPVLPIAGAKQTRNRGNVKNTPAPELVLEEAAEPKEHEHKNTTDRVITPPVASFVLHESPASDEGSPILRTGKLKGIGSVLPAANKQPCAVKKVQEASLLDLSVDPLSGDSTTLAFSASPKPDPKNEELENLVKLLANSSLMPPEAVSYLVGRKQALERELGNPAARPMSSVEVKHEPKVEIKHELTPEHQVKTKTESNFELVAKRARAIFAQADEVSSTQPKSVLNPPIETSKNPIEATTSAGEIALPTLETRSIYVPSKPTIAAKPIVKLPGTSSTPHVAPAGEAKFSIKTDETVAFKGVPISDRHGNVIGDHLLPGRNAPLLPSAPRNRLFEGPVNPPPKAERVAIKPPINPTEPPSTQAIHEPSISRPTRASSIPQSQLPRQESLFVKPKEESAEGTRSIPMIKPERTPSQLIAVENRLPVQEPVRPLAIENKAARIAVEPLEVSPAPKHPASVAKFEAVDVPAFPMTAATMRYFKGQVPPAMPPKAPSADKAKPDELRKPKDVTPVEVSREPAQPAPVPKFEITDTPAFPMTVATMQYFGGQMAQTMPPKPPSVANSKPDEIPEAQVAHAGPKPDIMVAEEEKPRPAVEKEREKTPENALTVSGLPNIPINAATLQYAKHFFQENPQALEPQRENAGNVEQGHTPSPQRPKNALSANARPFDPSGFNKENSDPSDPQSTFIKRMKRQGVSAKKVSGVYASRYAN